MSLKYEPALEVLHISVTHSSPAYCPRAPPREEPSGRAPRQSPLRSHPPSTVQGYLSTKRPAAFCGTEVPHTYEASCLLLYRGSSPIRGQLPSAVGCARWGLEHCGFARGRERERGGCIGEGRHSAAVVRAAAERRGDSLERVGTFHQKVRTRSWS